MIIFKNQSLVLKKICLESYASPTIKNKKLLIERMQYTRAEHENEISEQKFDPKSASFILDKIWFSSRFFFPHFYIFFCGSILSKYLKGFLKI